MAGGLGIAHCVGDEATGDATAPNIGTDEEILELRFTERCRDERALELGQVVRPGCANRDVR